MNKAKSSNPLLWILPLGCFGVIFVVCGGCLIVPVWGVYSVLKSNQAFVQSVERVQNDPRVKAELGEPITMGWSIQGNFNTSNGTESADITYPVSGPNGSGSVEVEATGENGKWTFHKLVVTANGKKFDLSSGTGIVVDEGTTEADDAAVETEPENGIDLSGETTDESSDE